MHFRKTQIEAFFLSIIVLELMIGGSGTFIKLGSLTLRMILYLFALMYTSYSLFKGNKIQKKYIKLVILFTIFLLFSSIIGLFNLGSVELVFEDIKPLSYFLMLLFFALTINSYDRVLQVDKIIKISSLILLFFTFAIFAAIKVGIISFNEIYSLFSQSDQFFFRGDNEDAGFFYKGHIFLCVGFIFFFVQKEGLFSKILSLLLFLGIISTSTRGLVYSSIIVLIISIAISWRDFFRQKNILFLSIFSFVLLYFILPLFFNRIEERELSGEVGESNSIRLLIIEQVMNKIDALSLFIGHGFGIGIEIRQVHMEISFLEIFHKQGFIGLAFFALLLALLIVNLKKVFRYNKENSKLALAFFLSAVLIYVQSFTNPYINNPIGMSVVLISLVSLDVLSQDRKYSHSLNTNNYV